MEITLPSRNRPDQADFLSPKSAVLCVARGSHVLSKQGSSGHIAVEDTSKLRLCGLHHHLKKAFLGSAEMSQSFTRFLGKPQFCGWRMKDFLYYHSEPYYKRLFVMSDVQNDSWDISPDLIKKEDFCHVCAVCRAPCAGGEQRRPTSGCFSC